MSDTLLDRRFGWRWLLPLSVGDRVCLYGFSPEEEAFWEKTITLAGLVRREDNCEVLLVNSGPSGKCVTPLAGDIRSSQIVCVVTGGRLARRWRSVLAAEFPHLKEYGLMPSGDPRLVVPLNSWRHTVAGLRLHRPGRWVARLGLLLANTLVRVGSRALLRQLVLLIASRDGRLCPSGVLGAGLLERYVGKEMDFALYLGTPDDNRKTVVLPLGTSDPEIILKVAEMPRARASLTNEASALAELGQSEIAPYVPKLVALVSSDNTLNLYQEYRPKRQTGSGRMNAAVVEFLAQLSQIGRQSAPLSDLLSVLPLPDSSDKYNVVCRALVTRLLVAADAGASVWQHRTHGDFAPWNCAWSDDGIFVYDWEESQQLDLALGDAFWYVIAHAHLDQRGANVAKILSTSLSLGGRVAAAASLIGVDTRVYLAVWLLRRVNQPGMYRRLLVALERNWR